MWVSGYFHEVGDPVGYPGEGKPFGFGHYSMNMLSPWIPQRSGLFLAMNRFSIPALSPWVPRSLGLFPAMSRVIDGTGGQYEGFNYLGLGVLLLLALALWAGSSEINSAVRKYWALALLVLGLTLLALSHRVFAGYWEVLKIGSSPPFFLEQLRASGRLFWPVGYTLMAMGLTVAHRRLRRPFNIALILVAAVLQFVDASSLRDGVAARTHSGGHSMLQLNSGVRLLLRITG